MLCTWLAFQQQNWTFQAKLLILGNISTDNYGYYVVIVACAAVTVLKAVWKGMKWIGNTYILHLEERQGLEATEAIEEGRGGSNPRRHELPIPGKNSCTHVLNGKEFAKYSIFHTWPPLKRHQLYGSG